jgi:hypothetical protein
MRADDSSGAAVTEAILDDYAARQAGELTVR